MDGKAGPPNLTAHSKGENGCSGCERAGDVDACLTVKGPDDHHDRDDSDGGTRFITVVTQIVPT